MSNGEQCEGVAIACLSGEPAQGVFPWHVGTRHAEVAWTELRPVTVDVLDAMPACRLICTPCTNTDHIDGAACYDRKIQVLSLRDCDGLDDVRATVEHTLCLMLALLRRLLDAATDTAHGGWDRDLFCGHELCGRDIGIVGLGRIGTAVAKLLRAFGAKVHGYDPDPSKWPPWITAYRSLHDMLPHVSMLSVHCTANASTERLVGVAELSAMQDGAYIVNTSRGRVVDEMAVLGSLISDKLAGAALDVRQDEPPTEWDMLSHFAIKYPDKLILTPHLGGSTFESRAKTTVLLTQRLAVELRKLGMLDAK